MEALTDAFDPKFGHSCSICIEQVAILAKHEGEDWGPLVHGFKTDQADIMLRLDLAHDSAFYLVLPQFDFDWLQAAQTNMHDILLCTNTYYVTELLS